MMAGIFSKEEKDSFKEIEEGQDRVAGKKKRFGWFHNLLEKGGSKGKGSGGKGKGFGLANLIAVLILILGVVFLFVNVWTGSGLIVLALFLMFFNSLDRSREKISVLKGVGRLLLKIILIGGIIWLIFFGGNSAWVQSNIIPAYTSVKLGVTESGVGGFFSSIFNPGDELRRYGSFEDEKLVREGIGVEMSKLETTEPRFPSGGPITVQSKIEATGMSDESSDVHFKCELDTYTGEIGVDPYGKGVAAILPPRGDDLDQTVRCIFEEGLVTTTTSDTKIAKLTATFERFFGQAIYPLVLTSSKESAERVDLKEYSSDETGVFVNDIGYSIVSPGPIKFEVGIDKEQPFIDEDIAFLEVNIEADSRIDLNEIDSLGLFVPSSYLKLRTEDSDRCDFEYGGTYGEFIVYQPNEEALEKLNKECKTKSCKDGKKEITLSCYFDVDTGDLEEGDLIGSKNILLESYYSFDIYTTAAVTVRVGADS
jgi:hypothetical protein